MPSSSQKTSLVPSGDHSRSVPVELIEGGFGAVDDSSPPRSVAVHHVERVEGVEGDPISGRRPRREPGDPVVGAGCAAGDLRELARPRVGQEECLARRECDPPPIRGPREAPPVVASSRGVSGPGRAPCQEANLLGVRVHHIERHVSEESDRRLAVDERELRAVRRPRRSAERAVMLSVESALLPEVRPGCERPGGDPSRRDRSGRDRDLPRTR